MEQEIIMRNRHRLFAITVTVTAVVGAIALPATSALAATPTNFGSHVSACAQTMEFSGTHNPGMHQGAAGWDGQPCQ